MRARILAAALARWSLFLVCASGCELIAGIDDRATASSSSSSGGPGGAGSGGAGAGGTAGSGLGGTAACPTGTADCDGSPCTACDSLTASKAHCGDCNQPCPGGCLDGKCEPLPTQDFAIWMRADEGITLVDGLVAAWKNQAVVGEQIEQPTDSLRPAMGTLANGTAARPAIVFDGIDDMLPLLTLSGFQQLVVVLVFATNGDAPGALFEFPGNNGPAIELWHPQVREDDLRYESGGLFISVPWYLETTTIVTIEHGGGGTVTMTINGDARKVWTKDGAFNLNAASWSGAFLGNGLRGDLPFHGRIGELIVARDLTPGELGLVHAYLRAKYGIAD